MVAAGVVVATVALGAAGHPPPQPTASAYGVVAAAPTGDDVRVRGLRSPHPRSHPTPDGLPASVPTHVTIRRIGVSSRVVALGLAPDGSLQVPSGADYDVAAWYRGSPTPGEVGPSVIEGHVDSSRGPSVFFRLGALRPGDIVDVTRADGRAARFAVTAVRSYPKDSFPTALVYGDTADPQLRLVTCGGAFDRTSGHYRDNVVAFAVLVG